MKRLDKQLHLLLAVWLLPILLSVAVPATLQAQFTFTTNNGAITITGYTGTNGVAIIPDTINGLPVTSIGDLAFYTCASLKSVVIPYGVTNIGFRVFYCCTNLANVAIPDSILNIGIASFAFCQSLTNVTIPNRVANVADGTFANCTSLTSVTIPEGVTNIGYGSFDFCISLTSVIMPSSVTNIAPTAFMRCVNITNITISTGVVGIGFNAFTGCGSLTSVTIPSAVASIGLSAFSSCTNLTGIFFQGNAPKLVGTLSQITNAIVYYLPETKGWVPPMGGPTNVFGGLPAMLWNPRPQTSDGSFGAQSNQFGFNITGTANIPIVVEARTDFGNAWVPLQSVSLTNGSFYFSDPQWTNYTSRFYRIRSP
jgi:hypothetical protein